MFRITQHTSQTVDPGLVLFKIFINNLVDGVELTINKIPDYTKVGCVADLPERCADIQGNLERWDSSDEKNCMEFNKENCGVLHMGRNKPWGSSSWKAAL